MAAKKESNAPNIGNMLGMYFKKRDINKSSLGRKLGLKRSTVTNYEERSSLQARIIWDLSEALEHNFFADIAAQLPPTYTTIQPEFIAQRIAQLEEENEMLKTKVETLMAVIRK